MRKRQIEILLAYHSECELVGPTF